MNGAADRPSPLDRPAARLVAVGIILAGMAFLGWIFRGTLLPTEPAVSRPTTAAEAAFLSCFAPQDARIAADLEQGQINADQASLFRRRAEAFCADQAQEGRLPGRSSLPGQ